MLMLFLLSYDLHQAGKIIELIYVKELPASKQFPLSMLCSAEILVEPQQRKYTRAA